MAESGLFSILIMDRIWHHRHLGRRRKGRVKIIAAINRTNGAGRRKRPAADLAGLSAGQIILVDFDLCGGGKAIRGSISRAYYYLSIYITGP